MIFSAEHSDGMRVFIVDGCILLEWADAPTGSSVQALLDAFADYEAKHGRLEGALSVALIGPGSVMPTDEGKAALGEVMKRFPMARASIIVAASGFRSSITRSLLAAIGLAMGTRKTQRVFSELAPAIDWVVEGDATARQNYEALIDAIPGADAMGAPLWGLEPQA